MLSEFWPSSCSNKCDLPSLLCLPHLPNSTTKEAKEMMQWKIENYAHIHDKLHFHQDHGTNWWWRLKTKNLTLWTSSIAPLPYPRSRVACRFVPSFTFRWHALTNILNWLLLFTIVYSYFEKLFKSDVISK